MIKQTLNENQNNRISFFLKSQHFPSKQV